MTLNGIVKARPPAQEKPVDRNVVAVAENSVYQTADHVDQLKHARNRHPRFDVDAHVR